MRLMTVHDRATGAATLWRGWRDWREARGGPWAERTTVPEVPCGSCIGARRILEPGPLGLLPVVCDACCGSGRARGGCAERADGARCDVCAA
jgi:hypothetical protein